MNELKPALLALRTKLRKYYTKTTNVHVYPNGVIFQPRGKLTLFDQYSWGPDFSQKYSDQCRQRYIDEYEQLPADEAPSTYNPEKRTFSQLNEDEDNEYEVFLSSANRRNSAINEYDHYIQAPCVDYKIEVLDWWRANGQQYPQLSRMVRDTLAVPATGAGVERAFSLSGRVVTVIRSQLSPQTIADIMMYKNHLSRKNEELNFFGDTPMSLGEEEPELELDPEEAKILREWRTGWWANKKRRERTW